MAVEILERWKKRFVPGPALYPPPPLICPAIKRRTFFAASLTITYLYAHLSKAQPTYIYIYVTFFATFLIFCYFVTCEMNKE